MRIREPLDFSSIRKMARIKGRVGDITSLRLFFRAWASLCFFRPVLAFAVIPFFI